MVGRVARVLIVLLCDGSNSFVLFGTLDVGVMLEWVDPFVLGSNA